MGFSSTTDYGFKFRPTPKYYPIKCFEKFEVSAFNSNYKRKYFKLQYYKEVLLF